MVALIFALYRGLAFGLAAVVAVVKGTGAMTVVGRPVASRTVTVDVVPAGVPLGQ